MKKDYRYHGIDRSGKNVQGIVIANNLSIYEYNGSNDRSLCGWGQY